MDELTRLIARAQRMADAGDLVSARFARELAKVWQDAERQLRRLLAEARPDSLTAAITATRAVVLRDRVRALLTAAGYDRLVSAATQASAETLVLAHLGASQVAEIAALTQTSQGTLEALRRIAATDLLAQGDDVATALWRSMVQQVFTTRPAHEILDDLAEALDDEMAAVQTLFDTQMSIYSRQVEALATEGLGADQPFLYVGPADNVTRPFCLEYLGRVMTKAEIEQLDNGQLPNPFLTGGGYNCRHQWLAVESEELRALAGTSDRVPEVRDAVARQTAKRNKSAA